MIKSKIFSRF